MATELERARLHAQSYMSRAERVRGLIWRDRDSDRLARHRAEWPELWEAIDALMELVDEDRPPYGSERRGLFERPG